MVTEQDKRDRVELAEQERIAKDLGMEIEEYVRVIVYPAHLCGAMPIFGLLRRDELWRLDKELGDDWWKDKQG